MLLLPEDLLGDGRLFALNDRHGPGRADAIGLAVVAGGWAYFVAALLRRRRMMQPRWLALTLAAVALSALAGCIYAFLSDRDAWGLLSAGVALVAQFALASLCRCKRALRRE